jgi:uncharacterized protein (DUF779 family)
MSIMPSDAHGTTPKAMPAAPVPYRTTSYARPHAPLLFARRIPTPDGAELAMLSDLLEAAYSGDGEFALGKLSGIRYYLYKKQIEVIDYSKDTAAMFDIMPAKGKASTMRPALVYQGRLLRKGIATEGAD